jgi:hypothetical protein
MAEADHNSTMIGLGEALSRLADDISDQLPDIASTPSAQKESSVAAEPSAEEVAILQAGRQRWLRRELAIKRLHTALCHDQQCALVQQEHGGFYQIPAFRWREHVFARDIIISGVWRDSAGGLMHLDGCPVFLAENAFNTWRGKFAKQVKSVASVAITDTPASPDSTNSADTATEHPVSVDPFRTGTAGRPTAKEIVRREAERRIDSGEVSPRQGRLAQFARDLASWWETKRKDEYKSIAPKLSANRIENIVRDIWRAAIPAK